MAERVTNMSTSREMLAFQPVAESYRTWVETLTGYVRQAASLLDGLYAEQDDLVDQLRNQCARMRSLRHADFDAMFGTVLGNRRMTRESIPAMVDRYRCEREDVINQIQVTFSSDMAEAVKAWPVLKQHLLDGEGNGLREIIAMLREIHMEQEKISTALSGLLSLGERLKIDDLKAVAQRLASRESQESAELATLLTDCESASRKAGRKWLQVAGELAFSVTNTKQMDGE